MQAFEQAIFTLLFHLPTGRLTTYGHLSKSAGYPNHARQVGKILAHLPKETKLPWFRVVNAQGKISQTGNALQRQKLLLEKEGFKVTAQGKVERFRQNLGFVPVSCCHNLIA